MECTKVFSTTYYVANNGVDAFGPGTGTIAAPWKTLEHVQDLMLFGNNFFSPGDEIRLRQGDVFRGSLLVSVDGVRISDYYDPNSGLTAEPVISGSVIVDDWSPHSGSIWKADGVSFDDIPCLYQGSQLLTLARTPNASAADPWLRSDQMQTAQSGDILSDAQLPQPVGGGTWAGATIVLRNTNFSYVTTSITAATSTTLTIAHNDANELMDTFPWGYFICDRLSELDAEGEWFFDGSTDELYLWPLGGQDPNTLLIEAMVRDYGLYMTAGFNGDNVTIENIELRHQRVAAIGLAGGSQATIQGGHIHDTNSAFSSSGSSGGHHLLSNMIAHTYASAIQAFSDGITIEDNLLEDIAIVPGLGESYWGYIGMRVKGNGTVIRRNRLHQVGYSGIEVGGNAGADIQSSADDVMVTGNVVEMNLVDEALVELHDGGGVMFDFCDGLTIRSNIVVDLHGDLGLNTSFAQGWHSNHDKSYGIYFGNYHNFGTIVVDNTVYDCAGAGIIEDHTGHSTGNRIERNTLFGNGEQLVATDQSNTFYQDYDGIYSGNIFYCNAPGQLPLALYSWHGTPVGFGAFGDNYYWNPYGTISVRRYLGNVQTDYPLVPDWQNTGEDADSRANPPLPPATQHQLVYNADNAPLVQTLVGCWADVYGNVYNGTVTVGPWSSVALYSLGGCGSLNAKAFLEGPYDANSGLMSDELRVVGLIPPSEPYSSLGVNNVANNGADIATWLPNIAGSEAPIDWVLLELRDGSTVLETRTAIVRADGQVIAPTGSTTLGFAQSLVGRTLAVRHRNHLGAMGAALLTGTGDAVDLTSTNTPMFGGAGATNLIGTVRALWAGDVTGNGQVKYTGVNNDRDPILVAIGGTVPTYTITGYRAEDVNLDGVVKYTGSNNDRDPILANIGGVVPTAVRNAQLP